MEQALKARHRQLAGNRIEKLDLRQAPGPGFFYNTKQTAAFLSISPVTLSRWRIEGLGPPFRKFGRRVLYAREELVDWADSQRRTSTSQSSGSAKT
jgi:hypothetical protein